MVPRPDGKVRTEINKQLSYALYIKDYQLKFRSLKSADHGEFEKKNIFFEKIMFRNGS